MNLKILRCLALVLSAIFCGCASANRPKDKTAAYATVTNAINREDWKFLRRLTGEGMTGNHYIENWEKNPVRVGKLMQVENDYNFKGKPCTMYSFALSFRDGRPHPHWLQIIVGPEGGQSAIMDFWEFGW